MTVARIGFTDQERCRRRFIVGAVTPTQDPSGSEEATPGRSSERDLSPDRPDSTAAVPAETTDDRTDATWAIVLRRTVLVAVGLLVLAAAGLMIDGLTATNTHPGAVRAYKELGLWDKRLKTVPVTYPE